MTTKRPIALLAAIATSGLLAASEATAGPDGQPERRPAAGRAILFLSNEHASWPTAQLVIQGFKEVIQEAPESLVLYHEFLDVSRFDQAEFAEGWRRWLKDKYRDRRLDLVVASGREAVQFLAEDNPWPDAALLYADVGPLTIDISETLPRAQGLIFEDHFRKALAVIKQVLPDTERVALVHGASPGEQSRFHGFAEQVRAAGLGLEPMDLTASAMHDLLQRVARIPERTVLFIFSTQVDASGRSFQPTRGCELVSAAANRPLFSLQLHELGCGIVGGLLRDFKAAGRLLGERAVQQLRGAATTDATVPGERYTTLAFDQRQLSRWGIPEGRLPSGSVAMFRERSLWRDHRSQVIAFAAAGVLQTLLIGWLLVEHRRRQRAEKEVRQHLEEARTQLVTIAHLDRRAVMGEVTAAIAHELNQPLEAILHNAEAGELMLESGQSSDEEMHQILGDIRRIDLRAAQIIQRLRSLLRKKEFESRPIDVNELTRETTQLVAPVAGPKGVRIDLDLTADPVTIVGDSIHLQQVLLNMLLNGIDAMASTPRERRQLTVRTCRAHRQVEISVRDCGDGIRAETVSQIFEPFYTTKGEGMGMGLSIARTIVEAHGGQMAAQNNAEGGATVSFLLPSREAA